MLRGGSGAASGSGVPGRGAWCGSEDAAGGEDRLPEPPVAGSPYGRLRGAVPGPGGAGSVPARSAAPPDLGREVWRWGGGEGRAGGGKEGKGHL